MHTALPHADLLAGFKGPTSKRKGGKGKSGGRGGVPSTFCLRSYAHGFATVKRLTTYVSSRTAISTLSDIIICVQQLPGGLRNYA